MSTPWTEPRGCPDQPRSATPWTVNLFPVAYRRVRELAAEHRATHSFLYLAALAEYTVTLPPPPSTFTYRSGLQNPIRVYHYDAVYPVLANLHARRLGLSAMQFHAYLLLDRPPPLTLLAQPGLLRDPELVAYLRSYKGAHPLPPTSERRAPHREQRGLPVKAHLSPETYSTLLSMAGSTGTTLGRAAALATLVALAYPPALPAGASLAYPRPVQARAVALHFAGETEARAVPVPLRLYFGDSFTHAITFAVNERRPALWEALVTMPLTFPPLPPAALQEVLNQDRLGQP